MSGYEMNGEHVAPIRGDGACNEDSCAISSHWVGGETLSDPTRQWQGELEAVLDPGTVYKHGVLVAARREIQSLRAEVEEWKALAFLNAESVQQHVSKLDRLRSHP